MNKLKTNQVTLRGYIIAHPEFSHEVFGEGFYKIHISVMRLSGQSDIIPLMVSERIVDIYQNYIMKIVEVSGEFRSFNRYDGSKNKTELFVFVQDWQIVDPGVSAHNKIYLDGFICKPPIYRKTPGGREIADLLLAVNRPYGKSDYIPCVAWGRNARYSATLDVGTKLKIWGRVQSREYVKKIGENEEEKRVAYEVSIAKMEIGGLYEYNKIAD